MALFAPRFVGGSRARGFAWCHPPAGFAVPRGQPRAPCPRGTPKRWRLCPLSPLPPPQERGRAPQVAQEGTVWARGSRPHGDRGYPRCQSHVGIHSATNPVPGSLPWPIPSEYRGSNRCHGGGSTCRQRGSTRRPIPARIHSLANPARGPLHPSRSLGPIGVPRGGREPWDPPAPVAGAGRSDPAPIRGPHSGAGGTLGTGIPAPTGGSTHGWQHPRVVARPGERPRDGRWGRSQAGAGLAGRPVPKRCLFRCWSTARPYPWPAPCRARRPQEEAEQGRPRSGARRGALAVLPTPKSPFASQECPRARLLLLLPVRPLQPLGRLLEALRSQELPLFGLNPAILVQWKPARVGGPATFPRVPFPAQPDK